MVLGGHVSQHGAQISFWSRSGGTQLINQLCKTHIWAADWGLWHLWSLKTKLGGMVLSGKGSMGGYHSCTGRGFGDVEGDMWRGHKSSWCEACIWSYLRPVQKGPPRSAPFSAGRLMPGVDPPYAIGSLRARPLSTQLHVTVFGAKIGQSS